MKRGKLLAVILVVVMTGSFLIGCKKAVEKTLEEVSSGGLTSKEAAAITLPISKEKITLSYFAMPEPYVTSKMKSYSEMTVFQEAEKITNISIKWREESYTDPRPKMNLMFSTGETEDIIWDAFRATGGAKKLLTDDLIVPLNSYIDQYAPNLKKLLKENPELLKQISTDDGKIYMFPEIRLDTVTRANSGFQIRQDWLDKLKLKPPTTIDEWYTVLKAFKEKDPNGNGKADEIPFTSLSRLKNSQAFTNFAVAFGILDDSYVINKKVKFGPLEPAYKTYIETMRKWYTEGLIDPEFATQEAKSFDAKITGDISGSYYAALSGNLGKYIAAKKGTAFDLTGLPMPKAPDGKSYAAVSAYAKMAPHGASIGKKNKNIVETVKWLDWHYSAQGNELFNWGIKDQAFSVKDNIKTFTDLILNNPNKLSLEEADAKYAGGCLVQMPVINDVSAFLALKSLPQQKAASAIWGKTDVSMILPELSYPDEKTTENTNIKTEVDTYVNEMFNKFVMGIEPMSNYDKFVERMKSMSIEKFVANQQEAYDKYMSAK